ncbi:hypothetical protein M9H77_16013 [Catharanthus roseus]|uniref:Uncharacterized protein n=1 Tax=Catharanthus roseus TaxID=4058 RepID=A0ACC0AZ64_CATRO|nr:hypothetical protein M9H77_16013 [Catharanthus roseus]
MGTTRRVLLIFSVGASSATYSSATVRLSVGWWSLLTELGWGEYLDVVTLAGSACQGGQTDDEVERGEGSGGGQPTIDPFDRPNLDIPSFSLGLTLGFFEFRAPPPPGTSGSSTPHQRISQASLSDEEERMDDMDGVQHYGFRHRVGKKTTSTVNNDDDEVDGSDGDDAVSTQSESDDDNDPEEGEFKTLLNPINSINPFSLDDLVESGTVRLLDWDDSMIDIQLSMRFVGKVQAISTVRKWSISMGREYRVLKIANDPEIPVSNIIQEVQIEMKSREHKVTTYNPRKGIYMVKSPIRVSVCRENGSRTDTYVPEIYSRQTYRRTYRANFHPVLSELLEGCSF